MPKYLMIGGPYDGQYMDFDHEPHPKYKYKNMLNLQEESLIRNGSWESQYATIEAKQPVPYTSYRLIEAVCRKKLPSGAVIQMEQLPIYIYQGMPSNIEKIIGQAIVISNNVEWKPVSLFFGRDDE